MAVRHEPFEGAELFEDRGPLLVGGLVIAERADLGGLAVPQASWRTAGVPRGWGGGRRLRDGPIGRRGLTWAALGCSRRPPTSAHDGLALRGFTLTRRRRNRTFQAVGYTALLVLKTRRATRPLPPRRKPSQDPGRSTCRSP